MKVRSFLLCVVSVFCFENFSYADADSRDLALVFLGTGFAQYVGSFRQTGDVGLSSSSTQAARYNAVPEFNLTAPWDEDLSDSDTISLLSIAEPEEQTDEEFYDDSRAFRNMDNFYYPSQTVNSVNVRVLRRVDSNSNIHAYFFREPLRRGDRLHVKIVEDDGNPNEIPGVVERNFEFSSVNGRPIIEFEIFSYGVKLKSVEPASDPSLK